MTIYQIKEATKETSPHFFDTKTLKFFGQTLASFKVYKHLCGRYYLRAPMKDGKGKLMGYTERYYNPVTNQLESC